MKAGFLFLLLFLLEFSALFLIAASDWNYYTQNRILLNDVKVLTFEKGKMTTSRRSAPIPQVTIIKMPPL
jgi:uncharacterized membrane protein